MPQTITNKQLLSISTAVFLLGALVVWAALPAAKQGDWQQAQTKVLGAATTYGTMAIDPESKKPQTAVIPILAYHSITKSSGGKNNLSVQEHNFERQMQWLEQQGYTAISLRELMLYKEKKFILPAKPVIVTFDYNTAETFELAVPILKKHGLTGSFAVATQFMDLKTNTSRYPTWQQAKEIQKQGVEIISATQDYFDATDYRYGATFMRENLRHSQEEIKANMGSAAPVIVYPFGRYDARYLEIVRLSGFELGLTDNQGKTIDFSRPLEIPRLRVTPQTTFKQFTEMITE